MDELRGFAVLGILLINIPSMGLPGTASVNPTVYGGVQGADLAVWYANQVFVDGAMRAIFSMLFGAGFVLFLDRLDARGAGSSAAILMARRALLLVAFGVFDVLVLLWEGDILWAYGIAAFCLLPFWKARVRTVAIAAGVLLVGLLAWTGLNEQRIESLHAPYLEARSAELSGQELSADQQSALATWTRATAFWHSSEQDIAEALEKPTHGWLELSRESAAAITQISVGRFVRIVLLDALIAMLLGMVAYRSGLLTGAWSSRRLLAVTIGCLVLALPLRFAAAHTMIDSEFSVFGFLATRWLYQLDRVALAVFWIGLVLLILRLRLMIPIRDALRAVGRLALSNYLLQSALAALFFFALDYYGELSRAQLYLAVFAAWVICVIFSVAWLHAFALGPAEWLWRLGTYGRAGLRLSTSAGRP